MNPGMQGTLCWPFSQNVRQVRAMLKGTTPALPVEMMWVPKWRKHGCRESRGPWVSCHHHLLSVLGFNLERSWDHGGAGSSMFTLNLQCLTPTS